MSNNKYNYIDNDGDDYEEDDMANELSFIKERWLMGDKTLNDDELLMIGVIEE